MRLWSLVLRSEVEAPVSTEATKFAFLALRCLALLRVCQAWECQAFEQPSCALGSPKYNRSDRTQLEHMVSGLPALGLQCY